MSINYSILEHAVKYRTTMFNITLNPCIKDRIYRLIIIGQLYCAVSNK